MNDLERLTEKFKSGAFLRPDPEVPNIVDLARALGSIGGAPEVPLTAGATRLAQVIGDAEHLVFVLADGFGLEMVERLPRDSFLVTHLVEALRTVFPSASPVALTTFATGEWPARHGVTGWWTHLPEITGAAMLLPFLKRSSGAALTPSELTPEQAFQLPALMGGMRRDALALFPEAICNSVSSEYYSGGRPRQPYRSLAEAVDSVVERVRGAGVPTYTYLYTPRIDEDAHAYGTARLEVEGALRQLDSEMGRLRAGLPAHSRVVVSADHGLMDTPAPGKHRFRFTGHLAEALLFPPTGDARALFLHAREGEEDRVRSLFRERYRDRFILLSVGEAQDAGLLGPDPIGAGVAGRFGDLVAISGGTDILEYVPGGGSARTLPQVAHHSGLTPAEMLVPLIVA